MSEINLDFLQNLLKDDFPDVVVLEFNGAPGSKRGDNYTSTVYRITITGIQKTLDSEEPWNCSIICKCIPESEERRQQYKSDELFSNEVAFYNRIWPVLAQFQGQWNLKNPFLSIPKCYLAKSDMVILKDLREADFVMPDRRQGLTVEQCYFVIRHLSQFHALSLAMKFGDPEGFKELLQHDGINEVLFTSDNEDYYKEYYREVINNAIAMVEESLCDHKDKDVYINKFKDFCREDHFFQMMVELVTPKEPLAVICHGDCWTNNFLFKSQGNVISQMYLVDFQLARYSSPTLDLVYLMYLCLDRTQREHHLTSLLHFYTDELHKRLVDLSDEGSIFHYKLCREALWEMIQDDFNRNSRFGLGVALDMYPIMTCDSDEAPNLYQSEEPETSTTSGPVTTNNEACKRKMADLVQELVDKNLI